MSINQLTLLEWLNCLCDTQAKSLIIEARLESYPFPFTLSTPYLAGSNTNIFLSTKEELYLYINLQRVKPYIQKKISIDISFIN